MAPVCRREVLAFASIMEAKLRKNDFKGGWENEDPEWLLDQLFHEVVELGIALRTKSARTVAKEAADVANYAMMIADVLGALGK